MVASGLAQCKLIISQIIIDLLWHLSRKKDECLYLPNLHRGGQSVKELAERPHKARDSFNATESLQIISNLSAHDTMLTSQIILRISLKENQQACLEN